MAIPEWPPRTREVLRALGLDELYLWWQSFKPWISQRLDTGGDISITTASKGVILTNAAGTITKRVRLNDTGDGLIFEDA